MLKGKVAVVTGGSRGIGAAAVKKLASMGADVAVIYAGNEAAAQSVCEECADKYGAQMKAYKCNVANFEEVKITVANIKKDMGTVNVLVNNAGVIRDGLISVMKEDSYDTVLDTNLKGAFNMIRHCSSIMMRNREGSIINITSISGLMGNAGQSNYAASKAGLVGLTKSVAKELAPRGIRCNAIAPGFINTEMTEEQGENPLMDTIPLKRMGTPEEIAEAVAYFVTANYVTGEVLRVDGGIAM